jgi:MFS family permease
MPVPVAPLNSGQTTPETPGANGNNYKWLVVAMLWLVTFFNYADRQALSSMLPLLEKEFGLSLVQLGMLGSAFAWVYGLSSPFSGNLADRIRRKFAILGGLQVWSVICAATALARNFPQLLFFRGAIGLGESIYFPAAMSLVSDFHGKRTRSLAMGIMQTSVYVGTIGGSFFAGLIGQHYGWRWSFVVFGILGVLLGVILTRFLVEPKRGAADEADQENHGRDGSLSRPPTGLQPAPAKLSLRESLAVFSQTPTVLLLMGAFMCANFVALVLLSWMPKFLFDKFHMSLAMAGLTATLFVQLASMVGSPLGGWLADRWRRRNIGGRIAVQLLGVICGAPFVMLCGQTRSTVWLVVALAAWGLFKGFYDASIFASVYDVVRPEARGTAAGLMNCVGWLAGGGTAPVIIGYVAQHSSLSLAISVAGGVYLLAGVLLLSALLWTLRRDVLRVPGESGE